MLTPEQRAEFERSGLLGLSGAVDPADTAAMRDRVWELLAGRGIDRDAPETWKRVRASRFRPLHRSGVFDPMCSRRVREVLDALLGPNGWTEPARVGQVLMTFPAGDAWVLPHKVWHLDYRAPAGLDRMPGLQLFLFLDRVEPEGGGTLAVAGSHELVRRAQAGGGPDFSGRSAEVRKALRRGVPWLRDLWSAGEPDVRVDRFMRTTTSFEGVPLRVVEMTGEAGDAIAMHPWMLHAPAGNVGPRPRMMVTERFRTRVG